MYLDLLYITLFVALIFESGFWDNLDEEINRRFKFYHLPHLFKCSLCQVWWLGLIYLIFTHNLSLFNMVVVMLFANTPEIWRALLGTIRCGVMKLIKVLNNKIK